MAINIMVLYNFHCMQLFSDPCYSFHFMIITENIFYHIVQGVLKYDLDVKYSKHAK